MRHQVGAIISVLRSGGDFTPDYVRAREVAVRRFTNLPHVCLSDVYIPGVKCLPLRHPWPGWWAKMEAMTPGLFDCPVMLIDLDSLIVDSLEPFLTMRCPALGLMGDFNLPNLAQSGVMMFRPGKTVERIWKKWIAKPHEHIRKYRGDGEWLREQVKPTRIDRLFPGAIVSLKKHALARVPDGTRIVCGHGRPRLHDPLAGWAHEEWKSRVKAFGGIG